MSERVTIWSDAETRDKLRQVADFYRRSMADQLRWMVDQELEKLDGKVLDPAQQVVEELRRGELDFELADPKG